MPIPPDGVYDPVEVPVERTALANETWRGIPEPDGTLAGVNASVAATKELIETILGVRGDGENSFAHYMDDVLSKYPTKHQLISWATLAAYAGVTYNGAPLGWSDITGTFQSIDITNALMLPNHRGVVQDVDSGALSPNLEGVYYITVGGSLGHNSSNSGRTTSVRLYDLVSAQAVGDPYQIGIGRNVEVTTLNIGFPVEVVGVGTSANLVVQIGGGDTLTTVEWLAYSYSMHSIGEYRGPT